VYFLWLGQVRPLWVGPCVRFLQLGHSRGPPPPLPFFATSAECLAQLTCHAAPTTAAPSVWAHHHVVVGCNPLPVHTPRIDTRSGSSTASRPMHAWNHSMQSTAHQSSAPALSDGSIPSLKLPAAQTLKGFRGGAHHGTTRFAPFPGGPSPSCMAHLASTPMPSQLGFSGPSLDVSSSLHHWPQPGPGPMFKP